MNRDNETLESCIHEAGHAVKFWHDGAKLSYVVIRKDGESELISGHPLMKILHQIKYYDPIMKNFIDGCMAGPCASLYHTCKISSRLPAEFEHDIEQAMGMMKAVGWQAPKNGYSCSDFFKDYGVRSKLFVISHFKAIRSLANELLKHNRLSGYECAEFLESIWKGPLPEKALKYWKHKKEA